MAIGFSPNKDVQKDTPREYPKHVYNIRECPDCGLDTIVGMPGGRDATCTNCGYKDPCCYD